MITTLTERVSQPDLADLPDWRVAEILTAPDESLPPVVTLAETLAGPGVLMSALGGDAGAAFLDAMETMTASSPRIRWAMFLIKGVGIDVANQQVRQTINELSAGGPLTSQQATTILSLAERSRVVSWAEHHGIEVTARTVGLARGAV
jgi:hypothetical protein